MTNISSSHAVVDIAERERAIDVSHSFIVRAPAGSGKTRLLIQRYLALLAQVNEPEEIVAITFTRKAATEMRQRVLDAFLSVKGDSGDDDTRRLAAAALTRNTERGWQIFENVSRLRMQTIDALNASITRQMPLLARFGAQPETIDDAGALYAEAARNLLLQVNDTDTNAKAIADDVATLLTHLDNNVTTTTNLLSDVLRSRDHWLRNLSNMHERESLEASLMRVRVQAAARAASTFPDELKDETLALARFAGQNAPKMPVDIGLCDFGDLTTFPDGDIQALPTWLALTELLLTKTGTWRKVVNKNQGFPVGVSKDEKAYCSGQKSRMNILLASLASNPTLSSALHQLRSLPAAAYSESQWQILGAIVRLLPHATVSLWNEFGRRGQCDFTEIAEAASRALGHDDAPTDLALALDYRISHLLVDEFQDTSFAQFEMLEKLTRGWSEGDGRTLFLVGDPMQSIYRFREAEVSLFSRAWWDGIGGVRLNRLTLSVNFRSCPGIVDWVNNIFDALMPASEDSSAGAVPYSPSVAFVADHIAADGRVDRHAVTFHPYWLKKTTAAAEQDGVGAAHDAEVEEATRVIKIIAASRREKPDAVVAILVRNRGHLREIVPALKAASITFRAVDIDPLNTRPVVQDLLSLTRALLHPADRIAWLSVLRAPWCGLTLSDLAILTHGAVPVDGALAPDTRTIWALLNDDESVAQLSDDGQNCVRDFCEAFRPALAYRRLMPLREGVENTWLRLRGPASLVGDDDLLDAKMFFGLLDKEVQAQAGGGQLTDLTALVSRVDKLFAGAGDVDVGSGNLPVQIMTIHKAKGLEFDTVIVPGLHRPPRRDDKKLIVWTEHPNPETGARELLLAPIRETGAEEDVEADSIYRYVLQRESEKQHHEYVRLLYVAATRAERRLHLLGAVGVKEDDPEDGGVGALIPPRADTLLAAMWPAVSVTLLEKLRAKPAIECADQAPKATLPAPPQIAPFRISCAQSLPVLPNWISAPILSVSADQSSNEHAVDFEWAGETARHIGSVVHALLQRIAEEGVAAWSRERVLSVVSIIERELARRGVALNEMPGAVSRVVDALNNTLADSRGRWTLQAHGRARAEWRLTGLRDGRLVNIAIDRTFVDEQNVRWIIDFKTGSHEGADVDAFLDNERRRYAAQLETYAAILGGMRDTTGVKSIRLGLYFPMLKGWREWGWDCEVANT